MQISSQVGAGGTPLGLLKQFHAESDEWGTDHDFTIVGSGDVFNGWNYTLTGGSLTLNEASFAGGELTLDATGIAGQPTAGVNFWKDFTTTLPLDLWPSIIYSRKWNGTLSGTGAGAIANANNWLFFGDPAEAHRAKIRYLIYANGAYGIYVEGPRNTKGTETATAWVGAFDVEDKFAIDQEDTLLYSDVVAHDGVLLPISRANGGTADTDMEGWPTRNELTFRVKLQLIFEAGCTRRLSIVNKELSMMMYGEIS